MPLSVISCDTLMGKQDVGILWHDILFLLGHQIFASCKNGKLARRRSEFIRSLSLPFTPLLKFDIIYKTWFLFLIHGVPVWIIAQCQGGHFNKQIRPFLRRRISTRDYSSDQSYLRLAFLSRALWDKLYQESASRYRTDLSSMEDILKCHMAEEQ